MSTNHSDDDGSEDTNNQASAHERHWHCQNASTKGRFQ